jgi:flagellar motor switch protein FliN
MPEDGVEDADAGVAESDGPTAAAAPGSGISQQDIDDLFAEQGDAPDDIAPAHPAGGGMTEVDAGAEALIGDAVAALSPFGVKAKETLSLAIESAAGQSITIANTSVSGGEYSAIETEFAGIPHLGFELRVSLSETESHLVGALIPLPDAAALFSIDTTPDQMEDAAFAQAQLDAAAGTTRELLDLVSLTLFTEGLSAAEVTLSDQRVDQPEFTMGIVADVAQGAPPLRVDLVLALPGGIPVTLTLVVPSSLATRIAEMIAEADAAAADLPEPTPISAGRTEEPVFASIGSEPAADAAMGSGAAGAGPADSVVRPAATLGASPDVDVHPVRFPPLPALEPPVTAQRGLDLIMDVQMRVSVELGRSTMTVEDVLSLGPGSVVELNKLAGEAVDILVNERLIARGEVVVVDENFGVRVTEIVSPRRRANAMGA